MDKHNFVTIADLTRDKILYMIEMAQEFERHPNRELLKGKVIATLFFEPSTRTRLSFETAANRLGAKVIGFADPKITSGTKGETLKDTILMVSNYADVHSYCECRRRCPPASFAVYARPVLDLQDTGHVREP